MTPKHNISFTDPVTQQPVEIKVQFTGEEWQLLTAYCNECERIGNSTALQDFPVHIKISGQKGSKVEWECDSPDDDRIAVLVHRLRPFLLNKEATYFYKICKLLKQRMCHPFLRSIVDYLRDEFSGKNFRSQMQIAIDESVILNANERVMEWLYACEYHRDENKKAQIDALNAALPSPFIRAVFCSMLIDKTNAILDVGRLVVAMKLGEGTPITVPVRNEDACSPS